MLSELFQLDEPTEEDEGESLRAGGSEDSYSDEDREEEEEDLTEESDENISYSPQDDSKAVAVIRSVVELSVPEKYKSTHQIRVSAHLTFHQYCSKKSIFKMIQDIFPLIFTVKLCFSCFPRQRGAMQARSGLCIKGKCRKSHVKRVYTNEVPTIVLKPLEMLTF